MDKLRREILVTRRSLNYTYFVLDGHPPTSQCPALLFVHGFPDSAHLWTDVIASLHGLPNKIIVPDCLGYAGTDKPSDTGLYTYKGQADDLIDILSHEKAESVIIIGHDWGSALAQRTYLFHRERFVGVALLNTGYMVPTGEIFDLDAVNSITTKTLGYPQFSYWEFFTAPDAAEIVDAHLERMWLALHGNKKTWMKEMFCVPGAMREFLLGNEYVPLKSYARNEERRAAFIHQFKRDGFAPTLQMYKATTSNIQSDCDSDLLKKDLTISVPILFVICTEDAVCVPDMMTPAKQQGLVPNLLEVVLECGHWSPMEKPDEIAAHIKAFVRSVSQSK